MLYLLVDQCIGRSMLWAQYTELEWMVPTSDPLTILDGLTYPRGVTIDFASRRLFWAEFESNRIQSSDLVGRDIQLVVQLPSGSEPFGITVVNDRIYWGGYGNCELQSGTKDGRDIQTLYNETSSIYHVTAVPALDQSPSRRNDCEGRHCSNLCVLTPTFYRCLD